MAERAGFEPAVAYTTHAFQACTLSRSVTSPKKTNAISRYLPDCKSGEGGIRTHGPAIAGQRFSRPPDSTALAPLRKIVFNSFSSSSADEKMLLTVQKRHRPKYRSGLLPGDSNDDPEQYFSKNHRLLLWDQKLRKSID